MPKRASRNKKPNLEDIRMEMIIRMNDEYLALIFSPSPDLDALRVLAERYRETGMPLRAGRIFTEIAVLERNRISVPIGSIIEDVSSETGYGGSNEKTFPVRVDNSIGVGAVGLRS